MEIVGIYNDSESLNRSIARLVAGGIERLVAARGVAVVLFDSDPELADSYALLGEMELPWTRVVGFQLAEWCGVDEDDPRAGRRRLLDDLVRRVAMAEFHSLRGDAANLPAVCTNYGELLYREVVSLAGPSHDTLNQ
jgi:6-phosphogluconolactonase/glucosamine-6-phosphate isomerase/deaminase